jgi:hypothetical protein
MNFILGPLDYMQSGFGSHFDWVLNAASWATLHGRNFFITMPANSLEWNYVTYDYYFQTPPSVAFSCSYQWDERSSFNAAELNDFYPIWSIYDLPHPEVEFGRDVASVGEISSPSYFPTSRNLTSMPTDNCALCYAPPFNSLADIPFGEINYDANIDEDGNLTPEIQIPHYKFIVHAAYEDLGRNLKKLDHSLTRDHIKDPDSLLSNYISDGIYPTNFFMLHRRWMHRLLRVNPHIQADAFQSLSNWKLRPYILPLDRLNHLINTYDFQRRPNKHEMELLEQFTNNPRFIAIHARRGDKIGTEMKFINFIDYVHEVEIIMSKDATLVDSWPLIHATSDGIFNQEMPVGCSATNIGEISSLNSTGWRQPQVVLMSDDALSLWEMRKLRPCWNWFVPEEIPPLQEFASDSLVARYNPNSKISKSEFLVNELRQNAAEEQFARDRFHNEWMLQHNHVNQDQFNALDGFERMRQTRFLMVGMIFLSISDYSIMTYSSNVGKLVATSRPWLDTLQNRLISLDQHWSPFFERT